MTEKGGSDSRPVEGRARPRSGLKPAPTWGFWGRSGGTDEGESGSSEDLSVSMERLRMRSMYFRTSDREAALRNLLLLRGVRPFVS